MARTQHGLPGIYNSSDFTLLTGEGSALATDANGNLRVTPASGASFGASSADGSTFTQGTTTGGIAMGVYVSSPQTLTTGKAGAIAVDVNRNTMTAEGKAEDAAHTSGDRGNFVLGVRNDTPTALAGTTLDYIPLTTDANGGLWASLATLIAGENLTTSRLETSPRYTYNHVAAGQATTVIKASAGLLHSITFNGAATATNVTTVYDNASGSGTVIAIPAATTATVPTTLTYDVTFALGLTIITTTANGADMTVAYL